MSTNKPQLKTYVSSEVYDKFKKIAEKENRSVSNYLEFLVMREIEIQELKEITTGSKKNVG